MLLFFISKCITLKGKLYGEPDHAIAVANGIAMVSTVQHKHLKRCKLKTASEKAMRFADLIDTI